MKKCVSCGKDLPDTAAHCVFCGAKQAAAAAPPAPEGAAANKTVMGFSAAELLKNIPAHQRPGGGAPPPVGPPPAAPPPAAFTPPPAAFTPPPAAFAPPPAAFTPPPAAFAPPPQQLRAEVESAPTAYNMQSPFAAAPPPQMMPPPAAARPPQPMAPPPQMMPPMAPPPMGPPPQMMPPPMAAPPPQAEAKTMFMQGPAPGAMQPQPQPPPPQAMPMHQPPPQMMAPPSPHAHLQTLPAPASMMPPPAAMPMHPSPHMMPMHAPPPMAPSNTAQVTAPTPPYLASQTAARHNRPVDPYADGLKIVLIVFGALLLAAFVTPLSTKKMVFFWDLLSELDGKSKVMPIVLAAAGLLGLLFGAIPLSSSGRGAVAAAFGITPFLYASLALPATFQWQGVATAVGTVLLPAGLLLRHEYRDAALGRILATIGALCVLVPMLVPVHDKIPLVAEFDILTSSAPGKLKIVHGAMLLRPVLAILALMAWIPGPSSAGAKIYAWLWILSAVVIHYVALIAMGHIGKVVEGSPNMAFFGGMESMAAAGGRLGGESAQIAAFLTPSGLIATAYIAFAGYGLAALLGKNLERK